MAMHVLSRYPNGLPEVVMVPSDQRVVTLHLSGSQLVAVCGCTAPVLCFHAIYAVRQVPTGCCVALYPGEAQAKRRTQFGGSVLRLSVSGKTHPTYMVVQTEAERVRWNQNNIVALYGDGD